MKVLCICNHGNNRSGSMAKVIRTSNGKCLGVGEEYTKEYSKHEAIAIGAHCSQDDTLKILIDWSDFVVDMSDEIEFVQKKLKTLCEDKYKRFDVGFDIYGSNSHPELLSKCEEWIKGKLE